MCSHVSSSDEEGNLDYRERGWEDDNGNKSINADFYLAEVL